MRYAVLMLTFLCFGCSKASQKDDQKVVAAEKSVATQDAESEFRSLLNEVVKEANEPLILAKEASKENKEPVSP